MSPPHAPHTLAFALSGIGLVAFVCLIAADRLLGIEFGFPFIFIWLIVAVLPAAGIALLFHGAAIERAGPPVDESARKEFRP
tara:strand:+ start:780 stop:1025 length:246 start_codon:yes stop_codon:yes gene_type:complete